MGKIFVSSPAIPLGPSSLNVFQNSEGVVKHCRRIGIHLHCYLNDCLQLSRYQVMSLYHRDQLEICMVLSLGVVPNWDKSELVPSQRFSFLGARFCLEGLIGLSLDRLTRMISLIQKMLSAGSASARQIHSLLGQMESMTRFLPDDRAYKSMLQWCIKYHWHQADKSWVFHISSSPWFSQTESQWLNRDFLFAPTSPQTKLVSLHGCAPGWNLGELSASSQWSVYRKDKCP